MGRQYSPDINATLMVLLDMNNDTLGAGMPGGNWTPPRGGRPLGGEVRIPLYSIIFLMSVLGNLLVIITLVQNKRMRTVTNVFLLNLSVSDLLLAMFCMPFTLIPTLLRNFVFGKAMCVLIRYIQGVSVSVSVFTLVAISLERYFAICEPLRSRSWQTLSHSYRIIGVVWLVSLFFMMPIAIYQRLTPLRNGGHKCEEVWNNQIWLMTYTLFLDLVLLVLPLMLMLVAYGRISWTLWKGIRMELRNAQEMTRLKKSPVEEDVETEEDSRYGNGVMNHGQNDVRRGQSLLKRKMEQARIRQNNTERSLRSKKRVIKMLFVIVFEFFVCWTPTYVLQTWYLFDRQGAQSQVSPLAMNFIHLLSYMSSCCNPITYCFMNKRFRQGFLSVFRCCRCRHRSAKPSWRQQAMQSADYSQRTVFSSVLRTDGDSYSCVDKSIST